MMLFANRAFDNKLFRKQYKKLSFYLIFTLYEFKIFIGAGK